MKGLKTGLVLAVISGIIGIGCANAEKNWERKRLKTQPKIEGTLQSHDIIYCDKAESDILLKLVEDEEEGYVTGAIYYKLWASNETRSLNPFMYLEIRSGSVFVNVNGNKMYDFVQDIMMQNRPCYILENLNNYIVK